VDSRAQGVWPQAEFRKRGAKAGKNRNLLHFCSPTKMDQLHFTKVDHFSNRAKFGPNLETDVQTDLLT